MIAFSSTRVTAPPMLEGGGGVEELFVYKRFVPFKVFS